MRPNLPITGTTTHLPGQATLGWPGPSQSPAPSANGLASPPHPSSPDLHIGEVETPTFDLV
jgi:hypothetical protein